MKAETFKVLEQGDVPAKQAYAIAHAIEIECVAGQEGLATKVDIANLQVATKVDIANLQAVTKADIAGLRAATKVDLANLRADLVRWLFLVILGQTAVLAAAGYFYVGQLVR